MSTPREIKTAAKQAELAPAILAEVADAVARRLPADAALAAIYRQRREFGSRDRRFFSGLVFAYYRWKGWTDALGVSDAAAAAVIACILNSPELHPAVSVLADRAGIAPAARTPLGALPLREKASALAAALGASQVPGLDALAPDWFAAAVHVPAGADRAAHVARCIEAFQSRPPAWLRIRAGTAVEAGGILKSGGLSATFHPRLANACAVPDAAALTSRMPELRRIADIQDLASQAVGSVCAPAVGSRWWDACCGAMGKSILLSDLMGGTGRVVASDLRESAIEEGRHRVQRAGVSGIRAEARDAAGGPPPGRRFDGVLVDAPCSGLGTWHRNPDARWRTRAADVPECADRQSRILAAAAGGVRPGGSLVYAVCTLTRAETEDVVAGFLAARADFALAPFPHPLSGEPTGGAAWIWPWDGPCNGMFIARFRRDSEKK